jgi:putative addiction module component (TIGR02574 family)
MTVVVNLRNSEEEKVLIAFLNSLEYDYQSNEPDFDLTNEQQKEILRREKAFAEGKTTSRPWDEIKKELENVYR